nr:hypothetical protein CFP56_02828 [Quercus suber]
MSVAGYQCVHVTISPHLDTGAGLCCVVADDVCGHGALQIIVTTHDDSRFESQYSPATEFRAFAVASLYSQIAGPCTNQGHCGSSRQQHVFLPCRVMMYSLFAKPYCHPGYRSSTTGQHKFRFSRTYCATNVRVTQWLLCETQVICQNPTGGNIYIVMGAGRYKFDRYNETIIEYPGRNQSTTIVYKQLWSSTLEHFDLMAASGS